MGTSLLHQSGRVIAMNRRNFNSLVKSLSRNDELSSSIEQDKQVAPMPLSLQAFASQFNGSSQSSYRVNQTPLSNGKMKSAVGSNVDRNSQVTDFRALKNWQKINVPKSVELCDSDWKSERADYWLLKKDKLAKLRAHFTRSTSDGNFNRLVGRKEKHEEAIQHLNFEQACMNSGLV